MNERNILMKLLSTVFVMVLLLSASGTAIVSAESTDQRTRLYVDFDKWKRVAHNSKELHGRVTLVGEEKQYNNEDVSIHFVGEDEASPNLVMLKKLDEDMERAYKAESNCYFVRGGGFNPADYMVGIYGMKVELTNNTDEIVNIDFSNSKYRFGEYSGAPCLDNDVEKTVSTDFGAEANAQEQAVEMLLLPKESKILVIRVDKKIIITNVFREFFTATKQVEVTTVVAPVLIRADGSTQAVLNLRYSLMDGTVKTTTTLSPNIVLDTTGILTKK